MSITTVQKDGHGSGKTQKVSCEGAAFVVVHPHPPINEVTSPLPFSQFFSDDGSADGSEDMRVNGATTNQEFYIKANGDYDIYIKSITIQLSDPGLQLDEFGALSPLTNGVQFYYSNISIGQLVISEAIQTNLDFFRDATGGKNFGSGSNSWIADISGGAGQDTIFPEIDLTERFGLQWGLRLEKGTTDKLVFNVRDNLSVGLGTFNIKGYGIRI